jgi:hypothetical protein
MAIHYEVPGFQRNHLTKAITSGWTVGAVTRDASGFPILVPSSQDNLNSLLFRPAYDSRVAGQPLFLEDPNCHCIDPMQDFILNPKAWAEPASGQFGGGALYYNDYRQQRLPDEQSNLGRTSRIRERMSLAGSGGVRRGDAGVQRARECVFGFRGDFDGEPRHGGEPPNRAAYRADYILSKHLDSLLRGC